MPPNLMRAGVFLAISALAASAWAADGEAAGRWFLGAEAGYVEHRFETSYDYLGGGEPDQFVNRAYGGEIALAFGYSLPLHSRLSLDVLGRIAGNDAEWTLDTVDEYSGTARGGPARLAFEMPFFYDALARPRLILPAGFSAFGEAGLRYGYQRLKKESEASTRYEISKWTPAFVFGGGLCFEALDNLSIYAVYRYAIFDAAGTESFFPDGGPWENVEVRSRSQSIGLGMIFVF